MPPTLVTWIMPVKNGMPFIRDALASIAAQTFAPQQLIVWDNGSTDGTQDEIRRWLPERIPGRAVLDRPLGLGAARARLVELADSPFCACLDADDLASPSRLEKQVPYLLERPHLVAIGSIPTIIDEGGAQLSDWYYPTDDATIRWRTRWQCSMNASSVTFRRDKVIQAGNYHSMNNSEDLDLWLRLSAFGRFENLNLRLSSYRRHTANSTVGEIDYHASETVVAEKNAASLFPGFSATEAFDLWKAAYPRDRNSDASFADSRKLERAARSLALSFGESVDYFTKTTYYRTQRRFLRSNAFARSLGPAAPLFHRLRGR